MSRDGLCQELDSGMAKKKDETKLPKVEDVATAKPLLEAVTKRKERLTKVKAAVTQEDKANKQDPKYRAALKRLKRSQRKLRRELMRVAASVQAKEAAAAKEG